MKLKVKLLSCYELSSLIKKFMTLINPLRYEHYYNGELLSEMFLLTFTF